jgi:hypothetical protein
LALAANKAVETISLCNPEGVESPVMEVRVAVQPANTPTPKAERTSGKRIFFMRFYAPYTLSTERETLLLNYR